MALLSAHSAAALCCFPLCRTGSRPGSAEPPVYPDLSHVPRALIFFLQHTPVLGDLFAAFGRGDGEDESTSGELFKMLEAYGVSMGCVRVLHFAPLPLCVHRGACLELCRVSYVCERSVHSWWVMPRVCAYPCGPVCVCFVRVPCLCVRVCPVCAWALCMGPSECAPCESTPVNTPCECAHPCEYALCMCPRVRGSCECAHPCEYTLCVRHIPLLAFTPPSAFATSGSQSLRRSCTKQRAPARWR